MAKILVTGQKHLSIPNLPRSSKHKIIRAKPFPTGRYPLKKIWSPFESFDSWQPSWKQYQVVHSFNSIQYTDKPWFVTCEDHTFLYNNPKNNVERRIYNFLNNRLSLDNCCKIIAISDYAKMRFLRQIAGWQTRDQIMRKVDIIQPNFPLRANQPKKYQENQKLTLTFVGNHLARKGGIVALRLAKKAEKLKLPIIVNIVSGLKHGPRVPTDFPDTTKYAEDLKLLDLDNIIHYKNISNEKVIDLLSHSHFQIMATLHDTYGYSIIEGFSVATPAITTNVCALPEFLTHGKNGYFLNLPINEIRHWSNWLYDKEKMKTDEYWDTINNTYDDLADQALQQIIQFIDRPDKLEHYESLSAGALAQFQSFNNSQTQNDLFDRLYAEAAAS
ncbi:MAG: glycosyltransferase [Nodularia sp. (in: Bacteria)]|nr:MAG: glycosyltransferase [Nodularia sp. (in: cyanobacteria)]